MSKVQKSGCSAASGPRWAGWALACGLLSAGCGSNNTSGSNNASLGGGRASIRLAGGGSAAPSAVNSPDLQKDLVIQQLEAIVSALNDGGIGALSGGGGGAGLMDDSTSTFLEKRSCAAAATAADQTVMAADGYSLDVPSGTAVVTITRSYEGISGERTYNATADGDPSSFAESWYPGPFFGLANIAADPSTFGKAVDYGTVPAPAAGATKWALPPVPTPAAVAAAGSSGLLGSVGWRSTDGSWTGAPVWEVATAYTAGKGSTASATTGMVMYYAAAMPAVTPATTPPTVGGAYDPTPMFGAKDAGSPYEVLGKALADGTLPSFQANGLIYIDGVATKVNQAGTVTAPGLPAKVYNPPATLGCDSGKSNADVGWRFSQDVAELTKVTQTVLNVTRNVSSGASALTEQGNYVTTWSDPALIPPVASSPSEPYFDQNAGTMELQRFIAIGTASQPGVYASVYTPTGGASGPVITNSVQTTDRITDTVFRNLNDPNWAWLSHTVGVGTLTTTQVSGDATAAAATITTKIGNLVWQANADPNVACLPTSGLLITTVTPADKTQQTSTIVLRFGADIGISSPSGVTSTVTCSGGSAGAGNCTAQAETDDPDYRPSGCNF